MAAAQSDEGRAFDRTGLLLINLGTPDAPRTPEVRRYLRQFLSDPRVLDISPIARAIVLNAFILPFRPKQSAEAYRIIWKDRGSPLRFHGDDLVARMRDRLGDAVQVELAMRYQNPSIESALEAFRKNAVDRIVAVPLFPQYSASAWGSAVEELFRVASLPWNVPAIHVVPPFYDHPAFLDAFASVGRPVLDKLSPDRVLMSFHGLPERHVVKSDESPGRTHCLASADCCDRIVAANRQCYRAQCVATARGIASRLGLSDSDYEITFQSRLGRDPWVQPYTDERVVALAREGVKKLAVFCPAFVADCLETIEEIGVRALEDFTAHGGEELALVPSLNSEEEWADALLTIARETTVLGVVSPATREEGLSCDASRS